MNTIYLEPRDMPEEARRIFRAAFPAYKGKTFKVCYANGPISVRSYWDGGSRDYYAFVNLANMATMACPTSSHFDNVTGVDSVEIPSGSVCVEHSIFCGKDAGLTIICRESESTKFLPATAEVTPDVAIVLQYSNEYKNSYGGETGIRFKYASRETGITRDRWDAAKSEAIALHLLRKNGAITPTGRNIAA